MGGRKGERDGEMEGEIERRRNERDGKRYMGGGGGQGRKGRMKGWKE